MAVSAHSSSTCGKPESFLRSAASSPLLSRDSRSSCRWAMDVVLGLLALPQLAVSVAGVVVVVVDYRRHLRMVLEALELPVEGG